MVEWLPLDGHLEPVQPRAIRLQHFSRPVDLLQHGHLFLMQRPLSTFARQGATSFRL